MVRMGLERDVGCCPPRAQPRLFEQNYALVPVEVKTAPPRA